MQNKEAANLRARDHLFARERFVQLVYALLDHRVDIRMRGELLIARVDDVVALGPVTNRREVDVDQHGHELAPVTDCDDLLDLRIELEAVLDVLRREERPVRQAADILGAVDDAQVAALVDETGITRMHPAIRGLGLGRGVIVLVVAQENAGALEQHFTVLGDLDLYIGARLADRLGIDLAIGLQRDENARLCLPIELLQVHAERAKETEKLGAYGLPRRVGNTQVRKAHAIAQRPVYEKIAEAIAQAIAERDRATIQHGFADAARDLEEVVEDALLQASGVFHAHHDLREHVLEHAGRREEVRGADLAAILGDRVGALGT